MHMTRKITATLAGVALAALAGCAVPKPTTTSPPPVGPPVTQFTPGLWHTAGIAPGSALCTWERDDKTGNPIGSGHGTGPQYADVQPASAGDYSFKTAGCQPWVRSTGAPWNVPPLGTQVSDGEYRVGPEIMAGRWTLNTGAVFGACHWQRLRDWRGEAASIIQEGGNNGGEVDIASTDVGVNVVGCLATRVG